MQNKKPSELLFGKHHIVPIIKRAQLPPELDPHVRILPNGKRVLTGHAKEVIKKRLEKDT